MNTLTPDYVGAWRAAERAGDQREAASLRVAGMAEDPRSGAYDMTDLTDEERDEIERISVDYWADWS